MITLSEHIKNLSIKDHIDLSNIPEEERKRQYIDLSVFESLFDDFYVYESIDKTLSLDEVRKELNDKYKFESWQSYEIPAKNNLKFLAVVPYIGNNEKIVIDFLDTLGWTFSCRRDIIYDGGRKWLTLVFDPKYQTEITDDISKYVYHVSPIEYEESILQNGLIPKSENTKFKYPNRIHLLKENIPYNRLKLLIKQLYDNKKFSGKYVVYKIDKQYVKHLYYDPHYEFGYYTDEPIFKNAIKNKSYIEI